MGCMCCRDRDKPEDLSTQPLPLTVISTNHSEADCTLTSHSSKHPKHEDAGPNRQAPNAKQPSRTKIEPSTSSSSSRTEKTTDRQKPQGGPIRKVPGGAESLYHIEQGTTGLLVSARSRETSQKYWIQTIEVKRDESDKEKAQQLVLVKSLDHPNVLKMLDLFQDEGHFYAVYEATEGGNAEELCARTGGMNEKWGAENMRQILAALSYCHSKGLLLKTLSAKYVLYSEPPTDECTHVKLLVPMEENEDSCLAPELKSKTYVGPANDLWNCGVLLSTLLAGECVFMKMQASFTSQEFRGAYKKWQDVSKEAKSLTLAMIARNIEKRPAVEKCLQHPWMTPAS